MTTSTATDTFAYDFNGSAQEHDEQQLADFEANFQQEFAHLSSNLRQQVKDIREDGSLSYDEKVARLRALRVVANADIDQLRQAATALEQQQSLAIETPAQPATPPAPGVSAAEQARLIELEDETRTGLRFLIEKVGGTLVESAGKLDITATIAQLGKAIDKKLEQASTDATKAPGETETVVLPTDMLSKSDVSEKVEKVFDLLTKHDDISDHLVLMPAIGKAVVIPIKVMNDELRPALNAARELYFQPANAKA